MKEASRAKGKQTLPATVDAYIDPFAPEIRRILQRVRRTIRKAAPGAEERISYRMPAYRHPRAGIVAWFGGFKEHVGLYPPVREAVLKAKAARYAGPKGNLRFRYDEPIPYGLIEEIVKARILAKTASPAKSKAGRR